MPFNLIKTYPQLLEVLQFNPAQRRASLYGVFRRDIEDNIGFNFRTKLIRPIKKDDGVPAMETLFDHLTKREDIDETGKKLGTRSFEIERSVRLHWIRFHVEEKKQNNIEIFSYTDRIKGTNVIRTYIYDMDNEYVVILEPQRSGRDYYLLTAYYLNEPGGKKQIENKRKKKLEVIH